MIALVNTSMGLIIGERINSDRDVISLKNPRQLIMKTGEENTARVAVGEFPWKPTIFNGGSGLVSYDVTEENILAAYRQAVTGPVLPASGEIASPQ